MVDDHAAGEQQLHVILPNQYITKESVETFYLEHEKVRIVQNPTLLKIVHALNRLACAVENTSDVKLDDDSFESRDGSTGEVVQSVIEHVKGAYERDLSRRKKLMYMIKLKMILETRHIQIPTIYSDI